MLIKLKSIWSVEKSKLGFVNLAEATIRPLPIVFNVEKGYFLPNC